MGLNKHEHGFFRSWQLVLYELLSPVNKQMFKGILCNGLICKRGIPASNIWKGFSSVPATPRVEKREKGKRMEWNEKGIFEKTQSQLRACWTIDSFSSEIDTSGPSQHYNENQTFTLSPPLSLSLTHTPTHTYIHIHTRSDLCL